MNIIKAENIYKIQSQTDIEYNESHPISHINWGETPKVGAEVCIANDEKNIYLHYKVIENNVLGKYQEINDPVYKDSCVEFFISFNGTHYYNFEFNCIGTVLGAYGPNRNERLRLDKELLNNITRTPSLGNNKITIEGSDTEWSLDIIIPIEAFSHTEINALSNTTAKCNFYKCGDDLPEPHFLSWSPINSETPDFHKPEFFGELRFN